MASEINDLFTAESLLTLQGSAAAAYLVPNVLGTVIPQLHDLARKWIALLISLGLAFAAAATVDGGGAFKWVVATLNGFLVAASALGINQLSSGGGGGRARGPGAPSTVGARFNTSWI
jgi:hypothetical protein